MGAALGCLKDAGVPGVGESPITPEIQEKMGGITNGYLAELPSLYITERSILDWDAWAARPGAYNDDVFNQEVTYGSSPEAQFQALTVKRVTGEQAKGALEDQMHEAVDGEIEAKLADMEEPAKSAAKKAADAAIEKAAETAVEEAAKRLTEQLANNPDLFKSDLPPPSEGGSKPDKPAKLKRRK